MFLGQLPGSPLVWVWHEQDLQEGGTRGTSYPGPVGIGAREHENAHAKFFCDQFQTTSVSQLPV